MTDQKDSHQRIVLVRHGQTDWSLSGQHTGRTNIPLNVEGERQAELLGAELAGMNFTEVLTSPLARCVQTCRLAGFADVAELNDDLMEWDYGDFDGLTTEEIRRGRPGWTVWSAGCPGGEAVDQVGHRADMVLEQLRPVKGNCLVFSHGHFLRILAARWIGLEPAVGRLFSLDPASISILGYERSTPVVRLWNRQKQAC